MKCYETSVDSFVRQWLQLRLTLLHLCTETLEEQSAHVITFVVICILLAQTVISTNKQVWYQNP
jgi:hypothetical protein